MLTQVVSGEVLYYSVSVQEFFHPLSKPANPVSIIHTQSSDDCPCVNLKVNKEYLIGGFFKDNDILSLPSNGALIEKWENVVHSRVKGLVTKVYSWQLSLISIKTLPWTLLDHYLLSYNGYVSLFVLVMICCVAMICCIANSYFWNVYVYNKYICIFMESSSKIINIA